MNEESLAQVKEAILKAIDKFIKSRGYIVTEFERFGKKYGKKDMIPQYNLAKKMIEFLMEYDYIKKFSSAKVQDVKIGQKYQHVKDFFGISQVSLLYDIREGYFLSTDTLEKTINAAQQHFQEDFSHLMTIPGDLSSEIITEQDHQLIDLYKDLLQEIFGFASQQGLDLFLPKDAPILNRYDKDKFYDDRVIGYGVVSHLTQFLGFDPLFFEPLSKGNFKNGN